MPFDSSQSSYRAFRDIVAENTNPILAWVGSGLSVPAGLPTWSDLKLKLIDALLEKAGGLDGKDRDRLEAYARTARLESNTWTAFSMIKKELGQTTYRDIVRESFATAATVKIPDTYTSLWTLGVKGVLNLNVDRLATRALLGIRTPSALINEYNGNEIRDVGQILNSRIPFIVNLHGSIDDTTTWVFTHPDLSKLTENSAYKTFIDACLSTHTVLFVGLSADDVAVGGHLRRLAEAEVETGTHYWLTDRGDSPTDQWAEKAGIRCIRYRSADGDHNEVSEFFSDLETYIPPEPSDPLPPVALDGEEGGEDQLPTCVELEKLDAESIRRILNSHASRLLAGDEAGSYEEYQRFAEEYDGAIYRAWYTSAHPGSDKLLGYSLLADVARGAFGHVYRASGPNGEQVAVKVLLEEIRRNPDLLRSFRRGVRSMKILHERNVPGMAAYLKGSEIPAFVVMEWIDGPNLTQARDGNQIDTWGDLLKISVELSRIIRSAHALPERVLHRDIRPSNVMLRGFYGATGAWDVVVLDFDLSWHRGAYEQSVLHTTSAGFLAPEQLRAIKGASTRHAAVDAFGIGMTLYYLCSGVEPLAGQHKHAGWEKQVIDACERFGRPDWQSLSARMARLIVAATQDEQSSRWDLAEIVGELSQLRGAADDPDSVLSTELLVEELAANCSAMQPYVWDADQLQAERESPTGLALALSANVKRHVVSLTVSWRSTGAEERGSVSKYVVGAAGGMADSLIAGGWKQLERRVDRSSLHFAAELDADALKGNFDSISRRIDDATEKVRQLSFGG